MFGSLVIVYPTAHSGGVLRFTQNEKNWSLDSGSDLAGKGPSIAYAVFFGDVDHEVLPVTSGCRVTVTYNLYHEPSNNNGKKRGERRIPSVPAHLSASLRDDEHKLVKMLESLLDDPEFLPEGGMMGFGLNYQYAVDREYGRIDDVLGRLKGVDAALFRACDELGLLIKCMALAEVDETRYRLWLLDHIPCLQDVKEDEESLDRTLELSGAIPLSGSIDEALNDQFV
jgi:hypothetical protein